MKHFVLIPLWVTLLASTTRAEQFESGQAASSVLGQADFSSSSPGSQRNQFDSPGGVAVDPTTGKVFVSDSDNHRILRFSSAAALLNGADAEAVIGQPDFSSVAQNQGGSPGPKTLGIVRKIFVDHLGRLWVADSFNSRVLCFPGASTLSDNPSATLVLGQPDFTTVATGTISAETMSSPYGVAVGSDDSLWVADMNNNRVLRFLNVSSKANGAAADCVLGQENFTDSNFNTGATRMMWPKGVTIDHEGRLWVADTFNHRVLRFDSASSLTNGATASAVIGQTSMTGTFYYTSATNFRYPLDVLVGPDNTLYVADDGNCRVMGFLNAKDKSFSVAADLVLGAPDFTTITFTASERNLSSPAGLALSQDGHLFVADFGLNRVVRYVPEFIPPVEPDPITLTVTSRAGATRAKRIRISGQTTGEVILVSYRNGATGSFRSASGTASWSFSAPLKLGRNRFAIFANAADSRSVTQTIVIRRR